MWGQPLLGVACRQANQIRFCLGSENHTDAVFPQHGLVQRRIQAVRANRRVGIYGAHAIDYRQRQPRGGMHRQIDSDETGRRHGIRLQPIARQIDGMCIDAGPPQPRQWRRHAERLSPEVVCRNQNYHNGCRRIGATSAWPAVTAADVALPAYTPSVWLRTRWQWPQSYRTTTAAAWLHTGQKRGR